MHGGADNFPKCRTNDVHGMCDNFRDPHRHLSLMHHYKLYNTAVKTLVPYFNNFIRKRLHLLDRHSQIYADQKTPNCTPWNK